MITFSVSVKNEVFIKIKCQFSGDENWHLVFILYSSFYHNQSELLEVLKLLLLHKEIPQSHDYHHLNLEFLILEPFYNIIPLIF